MSARFCRISLLTVGVVFTFCTCPALAASKAYPEYEVKAAFLYNFMKFTDWPEEKLPDANEANKKAREDAWVRWKQLLKQL